MPPSPNVQAVHCLICDDVRQEVLSKETVVGVYTAGISVPSMPWTINVCIWMSVIWSGDGELFLEVQILDARQSQIGYAHGQGRAIWQGHESSLTFRQVDFTIQSEGVCEIQWRHSGGGWATLRQLPIYMVRT